MILGIDTGGTKTLLALFSEKGEILRQLKYPTPQNYPEYLLQLLSHLKNDFPEITALTLALPAPIENNRPLRFANLPWGKDVNPLHDLKSALHIPVFLENDANLACLSECRDIKGLALYLAIGTGIGSGLAMNGDLIPELHSTFNIGHIMLNYENTPREWESIASGKALNAHFGKSIDSGLIPSEWEDLAHRIAQGLLAVCPIFKPLTIIFGGGIGAHLAYFQTPLEKILAANLKPYYLPKLQLALRPNEATVYGCYAYAKSQLA